VITWHIVEKTWGEIPTWGVILFPMIGYRGMIPRGEMIEMIIEGALTTTPSTLHQSDILFQRERYYLYEGRENNQRKIKGIYTRGETQRRVHSGGVSPKRYSFFH